MEFFLNALGRPASDSELGIFLPSSISTVNYETVANFGVTIAQYATDWKGGDAAALTGSDRSLEASLASQAAAPSNFAFIAPGPAGPYSRQHLFGPISQNDSTISLGYNNSLVVSGNDDFIHLYGSNDSLTYQGNNSTIAMEGQYGDANLTGNYLTVWQNLNTAGLTITGVGERIHSAYNSTLTFNGAGKAAEDTLIWTEASMIYEGANSRMDVLGANNIIKAGAQSNVGFNGDNVTVGAEDGDGVWVNGGVGSNVYMSNGWINVAGGAGVTVHGSNDWIVSDINGMIDLEGQGHTVTISGGKVRLKTAYPANAAPVYSIATVNGSGDAITGDDGSTLFFNGTGTGAAFTSFTANSALIKEGSNSRLDVFGNGNRIEAAAGSNIGFAGSNVQVLAADRDSVWVNGGAGSVVNLSYGWLSVTNSSSLTMRGVNATAVAYGSGNTLSFEGTSNVATISGGTVNQNTASASLTVNGSNDTITALTGTSLTFNGNSTTDVSVLKAFSSTVTVGAGSFLRVLGSNDRVTANAGAASIIAISGDNNVINAASGDIVRNLSGAGNQVYMSGGVVNVADGLGLYVSGSNDILRLGKNDDVTVAGSYELFNLQAGLGRQRITGFNATDRMAVSMNSFANWSALLGHASQSGSNTVITLDANNDITLVGVSRSSLQESQFTFG